MTPSDRRAQLQNQLATDMAGASPAATRMGVLAALCVTELDVTGAGATVLSHLDDGNGDGQGTRRGLVHASNDVSSGLEDLQLTVGEGPCLDTFETGGPVLVGDVAGETARWPAFSPGAVHLGAAAVFSFPLAVGVVRLGSLDFYRDTATALSNAQISDALVLADLATQMVIDELDGHALEDSSWLDDPHAEVHQASGMVQVQLGTTTENALLRLRAHAYTHELTLAEVARKITTRHLRLTPDDTNPDTDIETDPV